MSFIVLSKCFYNLINKSKLIFLIVSFISLNSVYADEQVVAANSSEAVAANSTSAAPQNKWYQGKWSPSLDYIYFAFEGTRPANGNIYEFEDVTLNLQTFSLKFTPNNSPFVSYSLVATHQEIYAETRFGIPGGGSFLSKDLTNGLSDSLIKRSQVFLLPSQQILVLDAGVYLPTGSINERSKFPGAEMFNYPYNMQLGSGTFDPMLSLVYLKTLGGIHQLGGLGLARIRTGENNRNGYHLGNDWTAAIWYSMLANKYVTPTVKLNYRSIEGLQGGDPLIPNINNAMDFYFNTRSVWDVTPSLTAKYPVTSNLSVNAMFALPVWQRFSNIDDVELEARWYAQLGISYQ